MPPKKGKSKKSFSRNIEEMRKGVIRRSKQLPPPSRTTKKKKRTPVATIGIRA